MDTIVKRLHLNRIDEAKKKIALDTIASELKDILVGVDKRSHHKLSIEPNYGDCCVEVNFEGTNDSFRVYPKKSIITNPNSNRTIRVSDIEGAYILGTTVYDRDDNLLGEALIREKAIHNKSDYSDSLQDAEYRFNSKIIDLQRLEKYIASEAINNMNDNYKRRDS